MNGAGRNLGGYGFGGVSTGDASDVLYGAGYDIRSSSKFFQQLLEDAGINYNQFRRHVPYSQYKDFATEGGVYRDFKNYMPSISPYSTEGLYKKAYKDIGTLSQAGSTNLATLLNERKANILAGGSSGGGSYSFGKQREDVIQDTESQMDLLLSTLEGNIDIKEAGYKGSARSQLPGVESMYQSYIDSLTGMYDQYKPYEAKSEIGHRANKMLGVEWF